MANRDGANVNLELDLSGLLKGTIVLNDRADRAIAGITKQRSHIATGWMKENASWTDRTGAARSGLRTTTEHQPKVRHTIHLFYSVPYGIWLEVRNSGRYAIILPALLDQGVKIMRTYQKLFARLNDER
jgi:hypothetical protein